MPNPTETININGREVLVRRVVGQVLHAERSFETTVEGSGGGGWVGPNGGQVGDVTVSSHASEHQKVFIRTNAGHEESFDFRDWNLSVRPGSQLALITFVESDERTQVVLATRNLDTGEEQWRDIRGWAQRRGLLGGKMRVWPSALIALLLGGSFVLVASYARARAGAAPYDFSDFLLASGIAFVPAVVIEWFLAILTRVGDGEPQRIRGLLESYLRDGTVPA